LNGDYTIERLAATPLVLYDAESADRNPIRRQLAERAQALPQGLHTTSFSPALYDTFAIITRPGTRLSPGVRELLANLEAHMRTVAGELDRSR
jgi:hypothetical protein